MARNKEPSDGLERRLREIRDRRSEPLRRSARRRLEAFNERIEVTIQAEITGAKKPKRSKARGAAKSRGSSSKTDAMARSEVNKLVTTEAQRKGDYQLVDFKLQEVTEGGKRKEKTVRAVRNLGGTPIERWHNRGRLDERQMAAILFYQEAWRIWIGEPRVTANYSPAITRNALGAVELWASSRIRAKEGLRLLDHEVFFREPVEHFQVWQNVVIWDMPGGVAGSQIGFCHKPAEAVAQLIVATLAHKIADVVIDSSRKDFGDLLLNIDAPRRPGRRAE